MHTGRRALGVQVYAAVVHGGRILPDYVNISLDPGLLHHFDMAQERLQLYSKYPLQA
jgi:Flp pilus assembly protein CpaB